LKLRTENISIIGAGPAGLAVAGVLTNLGKDFSIYEKEKMVAPMWHRHYDRLCLHTVKEYSALPLFPIPKKFPTYLTRKNVLEYLESYKEKFNIQPKFETDIVNIQSKDDKWIIESNQEIFSSNNIVICTGINRIPNYPNWHGLNKENENIIHSRSYKNAEPFLGTKTLVVGMGNTGAEISLDLANNDVDTNLSVRSIVNIAPRDFLGRPSQKSAKILDKLPFGMGDSIGAFLKNIIVGDLSKYGLETSKVSVVQQLKETGKTAVLDLGTVAKIKQGKIKIKKGIKSIDGTSVNFTDGTIIHYDKIILATGYKAKIEDIFPGIETQFNADGIPSNWQGFGNFKSVYFCGFDNYKLGGILGTIYNDSQKIANNIKI